MTEQSPALAAAFSDNHRTLIALARSVVGADEAPDAVQDAMLRALCQPPGVRHYGRWLGQVVRNQARQHARGRWRRSRREQAAHWAEPPASLDEAAARSEILDTLHEGWQQLDAPYREALRLRFFEGLSYAELGERLECSSNTASWRVREGISRLRR
ncbi:MAG: sigma-70 family RNA polymerase sigma factor [Myxococcota bacterium]